MTETGKSPAYDHEAGPVSLAELAKLDPTAPTNCQRFRQLGEFLIHNNPLDRHEVFSYESFVAGGSVVAQFRRGQTKQEIVQVFQSLQAGNIIFANPVYKDPYKKPDIPKTREELLEWMMGRHQAFYYGTKTNLQCHPLSANLVSFLRYTGIEHELRKFDSYTPLVVHATVRAGRATVWGLDSFLRSYAPVRVKSPALK